MKTNKKKQCCKDCQGGSPGKNEACKLRLLAGKQQHLPAKTTNVSSIKSVNAVYRHEN
ncbi:hypothetical protein [Altibacter sp. HG106]|uniref:hypothetical protein n=1 Tax=Altibacter sp. HG106 TaxID=3023937 RepID=UPI00234FE99C|nr:hypothetical protein [Altibacter sp. HG106]MDC7994337.1 hypothetical protein [Altibacter sp. HG106]